MSGLFLIEAAGSNYDIGYRIGKSARTLILRSIDNYRKCLLNEGWQGSWILPDGYLEAAHEAFPHLVEELQGMADGSGASFNDLFFLNALEEALDIKPPSACSTTGVSSPNGVWLGHNEDWYADDADSVIVIYARPKSKPSFISVTSAPFLAAVGMNEAGLAQGVNSLTAIDCRVGSPRMFAARAVLEAESVKEAIKAATPANRAGGYNFLLAHASGEIGNLETSACAEMYLPAQDLAFHTNHYTSTLLIPLEKEVNEHSFTRYRRLEEFGKILPQSPANIKDLSLILSDHKYRPLSICRHAEDQKGNEGTIFSVIFNLKLFKTWVAVGNPCDNIYNEVKI
ncbi:MAG: C45 family autoproteolytic acyltransferase/hydrolase [Bacillota bacterium]